MFGIISFLVSALAWGILLISVVHVNFLFTFKSDLYRLIMLLILGREKTQPFMAGMNRASCFRFVSYAMLVSLSRRLGLASVKTL